ncbi:lasso peptide biosynthesis B2 protein [Candidatus Dependentiae bacterium]|nr:lasso peptide biosynthesis B2 protein [Candidatus Dependentiae bacterium]
MKKIFFELSKSVYAAQTDSGIIVLDAQKDKYISIAGTSATFLKTVVEQAITIQDNFFSCDVHADQQESFNQDIHYFLEKKIIKKRDTSCAVRSIKKALEPGGLADYQWDRKEKFVESTQASWFLTFKFLYLVFRVDCALRRNGIVGILKKIEVYKKKHAIYQDLMLQDIQTLSNALDRACSIYPKKIFCLAWASAFTLMALKMGYKCNLVIGVQSPPFYAHAWAQVGDLVINDDSIIKSRLAIILATPFSNE